MVWAANWVHIGDPFVSPGHAMIDAAVVRRLALALPQAVDGSKDGRLVLEVGGKGFVWTYMARDRPKGPRRPQPEVLAVRCELDRKEMLIAAAPDRFFTDDHYRGYPAVLVRLNAIDESEFAALLEAAWRLTAPRKLLKTLT